MESYCLHYNTVTPLLKTILATLIAEPLFSPFRLVGGTNLSLRLGHRRSIDIDLFTDAQYDSLDFRSFEKYLKYNFTYYCNTDPTSIVGLGRGYFIGRTKDECIKLDLMYTEEFLILKLMKMEHTDENIYDIGNIANSLLKIIRNEE